MKLVGKISVTGPFNHVRALVELEDGTLKRVSIAPNKTSEGYPQEIQDAFSEAHTPDIIAAYKAEIESIL